MDQQIFLTAIEYTGTASGGDTRPPTIGAAPTSLTATADADSINLAWTNGDTYTATVILRKDSGDYIALTSQAGNATSYNDTTALSGITYTYKVRGVKGGFPTPYSNEASDTIIPTPDTGTFTVTDYTLSLGTGMACVCALPNQPATREVFEGPVGLADWVSAISNHDTALSIADAINQSDPELNATVVGNVITVVTTDPPLQLFLEDSDSNPIPNGSNGISYVSPS